MHGGNPILQLAKHLPHGAGNLHDVDRLCMLECGKSLLVRRQRADEILPKPLNLILLQNTLHVLVRKELISQDPRRETDPPSSGSGKSFFIFLSSDLVSCFISQNLFQFP